MRHKKQALIKSFLALLLCFSMLVGSTFAWFTDGVASGINMIAAGTLDVELYHSNAVASGEPVDANTSLFLDLQGRPILWEPGAVSYENLRVTNAGDLALAYQLAIATDNENFVVETSGAQYGLSQILKVGVVRGGITAADRQGVVDSVADADWTTLENFVHNGSLLPEGAGTSEELWGVVIYWEPGEFDNYWNLNNGKTLSSGDVLSIDLGISLIATQEVHEVDAFGADYDSTAAVDVFPVFVPAGSATTTVVPDADNKVASDMVMTAGQISAAIPAGVKLAEGTTALTMSITEMDATNGNITVNAYTEASRSLDVHIEGIGSDNTVPMEISIPQTAPKGLNLGNLTLYHVENDVPVEMTLVAQDAAFTAHNQFKYNPATGDIVLYMATFSEVAMVAENAATWKGGVDHSWYVGKTSPYTIANADQLWSFSQIVGGMNGQEQDSFKGKTVKLIADINLGDKESENNTNLIFYPIGYYNSEGTYERTNTAITSGLRNFEGTFDGQGHSISNFYHNTWEMKGDHSWYSPEEQYYCDGMGLFGRVYGGTVKNLTVKNFSSDGEIATTGVIAAYADGATFENISIFNCNPRVYNIGNGGIVGCVGWYAKEANLKTTFKNITVDNSNKISALWGSYDVACGGIVGQYYPTSGQSSAGTPANGGISFENCHIAAQMDVYNDVCGNYQYYAYRYAGMLIGSVRENVTIEGHVYPKMDGITASGCTVHFGNWNDYYYCEFEKNGHPSYSGPDDYKFSRVPNDQIDTSNGKENATCIGHNHSEVEDNQAIYLPFNNLVTGYGWGVTTKVVGELDGVTILDREVANSVVKFDTKFTGNFLYRVGTQNAVNVGTLFIPKGNAEISGDGVYVTITSQHDENIIMGKFTEPKSDDNKDGKIDWKDGQIEFNKTGIVKVTIQDYNFCTPTELYLEVVDAHNYPSPTTGASLNATGNNVVLLQNIGTGFTVSGGYTFYGNGFTLNYTGDGQYLNNGLKQGLVTVSENGTLDNLKIKASIYPASYLYYDGEVKDGPSSVEGDKIRYHYQLSGVVAKGNATVSNCYVYGARTNVFVDTGNVTIKNSILECGTLANIQIQSTNEYTVTLQNVTTIQHRKNATVGNTSAVMLGAGVIVGPDTSSNPKIVLNGNFKQYNWVTAADKKAVTNTTAQTIIETALNAEEFNHTINGTTASNLGIIYMNNMDRPITNNTDLPYADNEVSLMGQTGYVYSIKNGTSDQIFSDTENADRDTAQGDFVPTFEFDLGDQAISYDGAEDTRYLYGDANGVTALYQDGDDPITLDLSKLANIYKYTGKNYEYTAVCKDASGNTVAATNNVVTLSAQGNYTLEFTVKDNIFYNEKGEQIEKEVSRTFCVPLSLTVKEATIKNAVVNITKTALDGVYNTVNLTDHELRIKFLDCISVTDYDEKGTGTTVNLSSNISSATLTPASVNVFTTASTITITYTDGRVLTVNLSKISGSSPGTKTAKVNTSGSVYFTTDGALNNKPTEASSQNKCTITSVSYKGNSGSTVTNDTDVTVTWALGSSGGTSPCVTPDTLITLADGTQKRIDAVTNNDKLLVWDFFKGEYAAVPAAIIFDHGFGNNTVIKLNFSDGTTVKVTNLHQFYNTDLNKFVSIDAESVAQYVGHSFAKQGGKTVKLENYSISQEYVEAYGIISAQHYNIFVEGMISTDFMVEDYDLFNYFEFGKDMTYDQQKMNADIEKYGLYTYADFADYLTYDQFEAFNVQYFKIPVGKGVYTYEGILALIDTYLNN